MSAERVTVTQIRQHGRGSKRRTIFMDGCEWRSASADVLRDLKVREGAHLELSELDRRISETEPRAARERALRLLAARERTSADVRARLLDDGYPEAVANETVRHFESTGLLDDARFAEAAARSMIVGRRLGRGRAMRELVRRGLDEDLAATALDEWAPQAEEGERAAEAASRLCRSGDTVDRLAARLVRRGYTPGTALRVARDVLATAAGDAEPEDL